MISDAQRFQEIDLRAPPFRSLRDGDKRTSSGAMRYVRSFKTGALLLAACLCAKKDPKWGGICDGCGGAELTYEETYGTNKTT